MKTIWKYSLKKGMNSLDIPENFRVLSVTPHSNKIILHCLIDPSNLKKDVRFDVVDTGRKLHDSFMEKKFIGTVLTKEDNLAWHIFQVV